MRVRSPATVAHPFYASRRRGDWLCAEFVEMLRRARPAFGAAVVGRDAPLRTRSEALRLAREDRSAVQAAREVGRPGYAQPSATVLRAQQRDPALFAAAIEVAGIGLEQRWVLSDYHLLGGDVARLVEMLDVGMDSTL